jgi:gliding motility-associated-like protein
MKRSLIALLLIVCCASVCNAQRDTLFWFAAPDVSSGYGNFDFPIVFHITAYNSPAVVSITQPAGTLPSQTVIVAANSSVSVDLTTFLTDVECSAINTVIDKGIKITASNEVGIYYEVGEGHLSPDLFSLKGQSGLGTDFIISAQTFMPNGGYSPVPYSCFAIVSTVNNNMVTINPSANIVGHLANVPFTVTLNAGQVYVAQSTSQLAGNHLQGSTVSATQPIAVTLMDDLIGNLIYGGCWDMVGDQTVPVSRIGTQYIAVQGNLVSPYDRLYVTASQNNTDIFKDGVFVSNIAANQTQEIVFSGASTFIETSNPAYLMQVSGNGCEVGTAVLPSATCTGSTSISFKRTTSSTCDITLATQAANIGNFQVNGATGVITAANFTVVPGTGNAWYAAKYSLNAFTYPVGTVIKIDNSSGVFHLGIMQDHGGGTSYGYLSDFAEIQATASASPAPACTGSLVGLFADSTVPCTYMWTGPNGYTSTLRNPQIPNLAASDTGLYTVQMTTVGCGVSSASVQVSLSNYITTTIAAVICPGQTYDGYTTAGTYIDTFTTGPNCDSIRILTLGVNTGLVPTLSFAVAPNDTICLGQAVVLDASSPGNLISWSGGVVDGSSFTPSATATYTVTAVSNGGCAATSTQAITVVAPTAPMISVAPNDSLCAGTSVTVTASGVGLSYAWSGGVLNNVAFVPTSSSTYTVTGSDVNGCTVTATTSLVVVALPTVSVSSVPNPALVCAGGNAMLTASGNALSYSWTGGISNGVGFVPVSSNTYTVTGTNAFGCSNTASVALVLEPLPLISVVAAPNDTVCAGKLVTLTAAASVPNITYTGGVTNNTPFVVNASNTYTVTATSANACSASTTILIVALPNPVVAVAAAPPSASICYGSPVVLTASGAATYSWSGGITNGVSFTPTTSTVYTVVGTASNGCSSSAIIPVNVGAPSVGSVEVYLCGANASAVVNGQAYSTPGTYTQSLLNSAGCDSTLTINVVGVATSAPMLVIDTPICVGEAIRLSLSPYQDFASYVWQLDGATTLGQTDSTVDVTYAAPGAYLVLLTMTPPLPCNPISAFQTVNVYSSTAQILYNPDDTLNCAGDSVRLFSGVNNGYTYAWTNASVIISDSSAAYFYISQASQVNLQVADAHGCTDVDSVFLETQVCCEVFVPNAFSPNSDGDNDLFSPLYDGTVALDFLRVYDRWGNMVFETSDKNMKWNGTFKGADAELGVYFYVVKYACVKTGTVTKSGDILLLK